MNDAGVNIFGTAAKNVDAAEDKEKFDAILEELKIPRPKTPSGRDEAIEAANSLDIYSVRPSYVLGGKGMEIAYNDKDIVEFMEIINRDSRSTPSLLTTSYGSRA